MSQTNIIRQNIWQKLKNVAKPDSRFHLNFAEFIPDFAGSETATDHLVQLDAYQQCRYAFITPDNCLTDLRERMIRAGIPFVMSTYGIYRGFVLMEPGMVPDGAQACASWLDGMEYFAKPISLKQMAERGPFDFMVTGASAISMNGVRFGKGHGFFDLEWGMFTELNLVDELTPVAALVHDCQLVDQPLESSSTDILVDYVATPSHLHTVKDRAQRPSGVKWELLNEQQIAQTPPLQELQHLQSQS